MSAQENAALARRIYDAFNSRNYQAALALASEDVELLIVPFNQRYRGKDGFDQFMRGFVAGFSNISVDLTFESMEDFSPAAVARKVEALNKLLETRTQLANLLTYMDGKSGAEELIGKVLKDPALLQALASAPKPADEAPAE